MNTKILLLLLLASGTQLGKSQSIEWLNIIKENSYGFCIEETMSGNYILGRGSGFDLAPMGTMFDKNGQNLWERSLCSCTRAILYNTELPDGRILFVIDDGNLIVTGSNGKDIDTLFQLGFTSDTYLSQAIRYESILLISGTGVNNKKSGSIFHKLNLNSLVILSQDFDTLHNYLKRVHYYPDGSMLKLYTPYLSPTPLIIKTDKDGNELWQRPLNINASIIEDLLVTESQSIYLIGTIQDSLFQRSGLIIKMNDSGEVLWINTYLSKYKGFKWKKFNRIKPINDNEIILAGGDGIVSVARITDVSITGIDSSGSIKWEVFSNLILGGDEATDFVINEDKDLVVVGTAGQDDLANRGHAFILKLKRPVTNSYNLESYSDFELFPNPATGFISLHADIHLQEAEIFIFNLLGQPVFKSRFQQEIDLSSLGAGHYVVTIKSKDKSYSKKLTIINTD